MQVSDTENSGFHKIPGLTPRRSAEDENGPAPLPEGVHHSKAHPITNHVEDQRNAPKGSDDSQVLEDMKREKQKSCADWLSTLLFYCKQTNYNNS
jgi:hypothetical protein